jgi:hypothetical protein
VSYFFFDLRSVVLYVSLTLQSLQTSNKIPRKVYPNLDQRHSALNLRPLHSLFWAGTDAEYPLVETLQGLRAAQSNANPFTFMKLRWNHLVFGYGRSYSSGSSCACRFLKLTWSRKPLVTGSVLSRCAFCDFRRSRSVATLEAEDHNHHGDSPRLHSDTHARSTQPWPWPLEVCYESCPLPVISNRSSCNVMQYSYLRAALRNSCLRRI